MHILPFTSTASTVKVTITANVPGSLVLSQAISKLVLDASGVPTALDNKRSKWGYRNKSVKLLKGANTVSFYVSSSDSNIDQIDSELLELSRSGTFSVTTAAASPLAFLSISLKVSTKWPVANLTGLASGHFLFRRKSWTKKRFWLVRGFRLRI
jgi:hypothetical protein